MVTWLHFYCLFLVNWVLLIVTEQKLSSQTDYQAKDCTLSKYFIDSWGSDMSILLIQGDSIWGKHSNNSKNISNIRIWLPRSWTITFTRFQWNCKDFDGFKNITFTPWFLKTLKPYVSAAVQFQDVVFTSLFLTLYVLKRNMLRYYIWKNFQGLFSVYWFLLIMKEHKMSCELD